MVSAVIDTSVILMDRIDLSPIKIGIIRSINRRWSFHPLYFLFKSISLKLIINLP